MTLLVYENSWTGFLSAVFEAFALKRDCSLLNSRLWSGQSLFPVISVSTDEGRASRVEKGMDRLGGDVGQTCYYAWLSERPTVDDAIVAVMRLGFHERRDPFTALTDESVRRVRLAANLTGGEAHRFLGLTRLVHVRDDLYAADFVHDCNLLPLMGHHFAMRYGDQRIVIRDLARRQALVTGGGRWELRILPEGELPPLPKGGEFEALWKRYFDAIANPARKNLKLQQKFVPLKYRQTLTEFQ